ncbi:AAA family ATPase [Mycolicibacterium sp. GCM10028919]|uniref:helix-turn-helix transcriptional regulator n=1 Tax=Mycolicibacterium sp. GCM10028919 TaxID=3273401 RepID=UPI00360CBC97
MRGRTAERTKVSALLTAAATGPAALVIEGDAGIGKTMVWSSAIDEAYSRGFTVIKARVGEAETVMAYAAVGDLLRDVSSDVIEPLPPLQRLAVDRVLLRADGHGHLTDHRVVGAALASVLNALAESAPVLMAIDDVQWLDPSSRVVIAYAARRIRGRIGILVSERCDPDKGRARTWLSAGELSGDADSARLTPLAVGDLQAILTTSVGRPLSRPVLKRITQLAGGNPFYALELARAMAGRPLHPEPDLPGTLAELVRLRLGRIDGDVRRLLLAVASVPHATVDLLARVVGASIETVVDLLADVETDGIITISGTRVAFTHPLLARGVYTDASAAARRTMHRALAEIEAAPEVKARHLALATTSFDETTLAALDAAADAARSRGAPAAAAELLDLAIGLGGDKPSRRVRAAGDHFQAGNTDHAEGLLAPILDTLRPGMLRAIALNLMAAIRMYENNFKQANDLLTQAVDDSRDVPPLLVTTLMNSSFTQVMGSFASGTPPQGMLTESLNSAQQAVTVATEAGIPELIAQATSLWVHAKFSFGYGADFDAITSAVRLESADTDVPIPFNASAIEALMYAFTGDLDVARTKILDLRDRCIERGADRNLMGVSGYSALIEMWAGNYRDAQRFADESVERAQQLGSGHVDVIALSIRSAVHAHAGHAREARADAAAALAAASICDAPRTAEWPIMSLAFLEVSQGNYADALDTLRPMLDRFEHVPGCEIMSHWYVPNAAEAMIGLDRFDEATPLIETLETNGARLGRSWNIAAGARCRAMLLAARGDVEGAIAVAHDAMAEHERLAMPFEKARTELLLGKLQRRRRQKDAAAITLTRALHEFERIGAPLWANQARAELARTKVHPARANELTPSEQRVAELAAAGMSNRDIAAALFIGTKTVEHNLTRIYRKLGIRSRVELARRMPAAPHLDAAN